MFLRGNKIKVELLQREKTQQWLLNELQPYVSTDKTELSRTLLGKRRGAKAEKILSYAEQILSRHT